MHTGEKLKRHNQDYPNLGHYPLTWNRWQFQSIATEEQPCSAPQKTSGCPALSRITPHWTFSHTHTHTQSQASRKKTSTGENPDSSCPLFSVENTEEKIVIRTLPIACLKCLPLTARLEESEEEVTACLWAELPNLLQNWRICLSAESSVTSKREL